MVRRYHKHEVGKNKVYSHKFPIFHRSKRARFFHDEEIKLYGQKGKVRTYSKGRTIPKRVLYAGYVGIPATVALVLVISLLGLTYTAYSPEYQICEGVCEYKFALTNPSWTLEKCVADGTRIIFFNESIQYELWSDGKNVTNGDWCIGAGQTRNFTLIGYKEPDQSVKFNVSAENIFIDPYFLGKKKDIKTGLQAFEEKFLEVQVLNKDPFTEIEVSSFSWDEKTKKVTATVNIKATNRTPEDFTGDIDFKDKNNKLKNVKHDSLTASKNKNYKFNSKNEMTTSYDIEFEYDSLDDVSYEIKAGNGSALSIIQTASWYNVSNTGFYGIDFYVGDTDCNAWTQMGIHNATARLSSTSYASHGGPQSRSVGGNVYWGADSRGGANCVGDMGTQSQSWFINSSLLIISGVSNGSHSLYYNTTYMDKYPFIMSEYKMPFASTTGDFALRPVNDGINRSNLTYGPVWIGNVTDFLPTDLAVLQQHLALSAGFSFWKTSDNESNTQSLITSWNGTPNRFEWATSGDNVSSTVGYGPSIFNEGNWNPVGNNWTWGFSDNGTGYSTAMAIHNLTRTNVPTFTADIGTAFKHNTQVFIVQPNTTGVATLWSNNSIAIPESYRDWKYGVLTNTSAITGSTIKVKRNIGGGTPVDWCWYNYTTATSSNTSRCVIGNTTNSWLVTALEQTGNQTMYYTFDVYVQPPPTEEANVTLELNGTANNSRIYETGSPVNISAWANVSTEICLTIDYPDRDNYTCGYGNIEDSPYIVLGGNIYSAYSDECTTLGCVQTEAYTNMKEVNLTDNGAFYFNFSKNASFKNGSINLTGYESNETGLRSGNLQIDVGNDSVIDFITSGYLHSDRIHTIEFNDSKTEKTLNWSDSGEGRKKIYINLTPDFDIFSSAYITVNTSAYNAKSTLFNDSSPSVSKNFTIVNDTMGASWNTTSGVIPLNLTVDLYGFNLYDTTAEWNHTYIGNQDWEDDADGTPVPTGWEEFCEGTACNDTSKTETYVSTVNYTNGSQGFRMHKGNLQSGFYGISREMNFTSIDMIQFDFSQPTSGLGTANFQFRVRLDGDIIYSRDDLGGSGTYLLLNQTAWINKSGMGNLSFTIEGDNTGTNSGFNYLDNLRFISNGSVEQVEIYLEGSNTPAYSNYTSKIRGLTRATLDNDIVQLSIDRCVPSNGSCPINATIHTYSGNLTINNTNFTWMHTMENLQIDVGDDGEIDYNLSGRVNSTNTPINIDLNTTNLTQFINSTCTSTGNCTLPISIGTSSKGALTVNNITINQTMGRIPINATAVERYIATHTKNETSVFNETAVSKLLIPIQFSGNGTSYFKVHNIRSFFNGTSNHTIFANSTANDTYNSGSDKVDYKVAYSNFTRWDAFPFLTFIPKNATQQGIEPYNQSATMPFYNFTSRAVDYDWKLNISFNESLPTCLNITYNKTGNISSQENVSTTWTTINESIPWTPAGNQSMWLYINLNKCNATSIQYPVQRLMKIQSICTICEGA